MEQRRKKNSEDCLWVRVRNVLFADDTTILATSDEMEKDKETTKYNMNLCGENTNTKEENITLETAEAEVTRFL